MNAKEKARSSAATPERAMDSIKSAGCAALQSTVQSHDTMPDVDFQGRIALRPKEAAPLIGVGVNRIYQLCHQADFPSVRVGSSFIIPVDALCRWLDTQAQRGVAL